MPVDARPARLADCPITVEGFSGPLDLLLRLVEERRLPVTELSLVAVTDQFLAHLASLDDVPLELVADFTVVAARLVALKARALLPRPAEPEPAGEPAPDDLIRQLQLYQAFRDAARELRLREQRGRRAHARSSAPPLPPARPEVGGLEPAVLLAALRRWYRRVEPHPVTLRLPPAISLRAMARRLLSRLRGGARTFRELVGRRADRRELAAGFLALLMLIRRGAVQAEQPVPFGEITVVPRERHLREAAADD